MSPHVRRLDEMSAQECFSHLRSAEVGRVVFTLGALPAVLPMTFALHGGDLLMATAADSRLASAVHGGVLAFEVDDIDVASRTGWSVVVFGIAQVLDQDSGRAEAATIVAPWVPGRDDLIIRVPCTRVTGRRITAGRAAGDHDAGVLSAAAGR
jgi:uncharacterized protein